MYWKLGLKFISTCVLLEFFGKIPRDFNISIYCWQLVLLKMHEYGQYLLNFFTSSTSCIWGLYTLIYQQAWINSNCCIYILFLEGQYSGRKLLLGRWWQSVSAWKPELQITFWATLVLNTVLFIHLNTVLFIDLYCTCTLYTVCKTYFSVLFRQLVYHNFKIHMNYLTDLQLYLRNILNFYCTQLFVFHISFLTWNRSRTDFEYICIPFTLQFILWWYFLKSNS